MENLYHMEKQGMEPGEMHEQLMSKRNPKDVVVCDTYQLVKWTEKVGGSSATMVPVGLGDGFLVEDAYGTVKSQMELLVGPCPMMGLFVLVSESLHGGMALSAKRIGTWCILCIRTCGMALGKWCGCGLT
ncbi:hypothetical protein MRB53_012751 [Persea americana]|uniref:Uncharacterized protein n=1 Tax=Persea americana TaxID=3435 RepID=A0ACC2LYF9_PERAE|nr:hypothetical protein MRB53_012751 [Persea americana]